MKNEFREHIPGFAYNGYEVPEVIQFDTLEELLNNKRFERLKADKDWHFCYSDKSLMTCSNDNSSWYVLGYIKFPESLGLPEWKYEDMRKK